MDSLWGLIILGMVGWLFYKTGKSIGSRKGFNVGRGRGRRRPR